jgi:hypothetical protein
MLPRFVVNAVKHSGIAIHKRNLFPFVAIGRNGDNRGDNLIHFAK